MHVAPAYRSTDVVVAVTLVTVCCGEVIVVVTVVVSVMVKVSA